MSSDGVVVGLLLLLGGLAVWGGAMVLLVRHPERHYRVAGHDKRAWAIVQVVGGLSALGLLTSLVFLVVVWPSLRRAARADGQGLAGARSTAAAPGVRPDGVEREAPAWRAQGGGALHVRIHDRSVARHRVKILVDDVVTTRPTRRDPSAVHLDAGRHELVARLDWLSSPPVVVNMPPGGDVHVTVRVKDEASSLESTLVRPEEAIEVLVEPTHRDAAASGCAPARQPAPRSQSPEAAEWDGPFRRSPTGRRP